MKEIKITLKPDYTIEVVNGPDHPIFNNITKYMSDGYAIDHIWMRAIVEARLRQFAYLNKNISIRFCDEINKNEIVYHYPNGIKTFVKDICGKRARGRGVDVCGIDEVIYFEKHDPVSKMSVEIAFVFNNKIHFGVTHCFVNDIYNIRGGSHLKAFNIGISDYINDHMRVDQHIVAVISCRVDDNIPFNMPEYINPSIQEFIRTAVRENTSDVPCDRL